MAHEMSTMSHGPPIWFLLLHHLPVPSCCCCPLSYLLAVAALGVIVIQ